MVVQSVLDRPSVLYIVSRRSSCGDAGAAQVLSLHLGLPGSFCPVASLASGDDIRLGVEGSPAGETTP